tara:strand:+ start:1747 stop:1998 length:252 start_codon:yes stop_codon:yes gene_type:complete
MRQEAEKIANYYETRASQFANLEQAVLEFDEGHTGQWMWDYLFEYALRKEEADKMFNLLDDKTIDMLAGFKVSFIIGIADEQG